MKTTADSLLIHVETQTYPLKIHDLRYRHTNISFPDEWEYERLELLGYRVVAHSPVPEGDVVVELPPALVEGQWTRQWLGRAFNTAELLAQLQTAQAESLVVLDALRSEALKQGASFVVPSGQTYHIQLRDSDRGNFTFLYLQKSVTQTPIHFRFLENVSVELSFEQFGELVRRAWDVYDQIQTRYWELKDAVASAPTLVEIPALPNSLLDGEHDV